MVVAAAYISAMTWNGDSPPWPLQSVYIYEIFDDGTWNARGVGLYNPDVAPYGYELSVPIIPSGLDVVRAPVSARPRVVIASTGSGSYDAHRLVWADLPEDVDYASASIYADVDSSFGGVDDYYVHLYSSETGDLDFPATDVQLIDTLPTPFGGPSFPPRNLVIFALAAGSAPVSPPFWTDFVGAKEIL